MLSCLQDKTWYYILDFYRKSKYYNLHMSFQLKNATVCWLDFVP